MKASEARAIAESARRIKSLTPIFGLIRAAAARGDNDIEVNDAVLNSNLAAMLRHPDFEYEVERTRAEHWRVSW